MRRKKMKVENKETKTKEKNQKYKYYEIKVCIKNTHPPVWRRLQIPSGITFGELNAIIQIAFGWGGYHLYEFTAGTTCIEVPDEDIKMYGKEIIDAKKTLIDNYVKQYPKIKYIYDFGDYWVHEITIEKIIETDIKLETPICIKAKMADLPEDCGGPWGYEDLLSVLSDRKNERYEELKDWVEGVISNWNDDRTYVDREKINQKLEKFKEGTKF